MTALLTDETFSWYAAPVVGGVVWTEIFTDGFESGTTGGVEMRLDDRFYVFEMFLVAAVVLLSVMKLCGDIDWTWWAVAAPVWGYLVGIGLGTRFEDYL